MPLLRPIAIGILLLAAQVSASAAEVAVLRNGSQISFVRKEEISPGTTRLYLASGHLDMPTADIESIEKEETPAPLPAANTSETVANPNPVVATISSTATQPSQTAGVLPATSTKPSRNPNLTSLCVRPRQRTVLTLILWPA